MTRLATTLVLTADHAFRARRRASGLARLAAISSAFRFVDISVREVPASNCSLSGVNVYRCNHQRVVRHAMHVDA